VGVFQDNQAADGMVNIICTNGGADILQQKGSIGLIDLGIGKNPAKRRYSTALKEKSMPKVPHDHLIPTLTMSKDGNQVAHGSGCHKQSALHSHLLGSQRFQPVDSGILSIYIVPHFRLSHCLPHFRGWMCYRIGTQVDH